MPGEKDLLSSEAYNTFCAAAGHHEWLPWEELPPIVQDAWRKAVATVVDRVLDPKVSEEPKK